MSYAISGSRLLVEPDVLPAAEVLRAEPARAAEVALHVLRRGLGRRTPQDEDPRRLVEDDLLGLEVDRLALLGVGRLRTPREQLVEPVVLELRRDGVTDCGRVEERAKVVGVRPRE